MTSNVILLADDEPWQRMWISQVLHKAGYICSTVADGEQVVERALAVGPSLIILDIEMPGVNGFEAAQQLRILPNTRNVPILFVTSYSRGPSEFASTLIDRAELMMKPFHPDELLARVQRLVQHR